MEKCGNKFRYMKRFIFYNFNFIRIHKSWYLEVTPIHARRTKHTQAQAQG